MFVISAVVAANIVAAVPMTSKPWFDFNDYPDSALSAGIEGVSEIEVVVSPEGRAIGCSIVHSTGQAVLDRRACALALRNARFQPARNRALQPTYGTYRSRILWSIDPDQWGQYGPSPALQLTLAHWPAGLPSPLQLEYAVEVDRAGQAVRCAPVSTAYAALAAASCAAVMKGLPVSPVRLADGTAVPAVRSVWVGYAL